MLERLGHEVVFPEEQTCCGQMHVNSGYRDEATALARAFVEVFAEFEHDRLAVRIVRRLVRDLPLAREAGDEPPELASRAALFELSELLVDRLGVDDVGAYFPHRVAYHPTCHSLRVTRVGDAPLRLLRAVRGLELLELPDASECCGFGGTFAVKNADTSTAMLADKMRGDRCDRAPRSARPLDSSCLMQIGGGLSRAARRRAHACISPRSSPQRAMSDAAAFPAAARVALGDAQLRAQPAQRHRDDPRQARPRRRRGPRLGGAARGRRARSRRDVLAPSRRSYLLQFEAAVDARRRPGALGARRRRGERDRRSSSPRAHGGRGGRQGQVAHDRRDRAQRRTRRRRASRRIETDLAELILQLAGDWSSHILVPAIHRNRAEIRDLFRAHDRRGADSRRRPGALAEAARALPARAVPDARRWRSAAPTSRSPRPGTVCVVESEGNGRMCTTLPPVLVTVMGIEKLVPALCATSRSSCSCCRAPRPASE